MRRTALYPGLLVCYVIKARGTARERETGKFEIDQINPRGPHKGHASHRATQVGLTPSHPAFKGMPPMTTKENSVVVVSTTIQVSASMTVSCYRNKRDGNRMVWKP